jgi:hypothetical protein
MNATIVTDHEDVFARAWADPRNTRGERPPVDVNAVLAAHYKLSKPLAFTRPMLWDMEVRKAFRPDIYIKSVVKEGSSGTWGLQKHDDGAESFFRKSAQRLRLGLDTELTHGLVLEQVRVNPANGKVTFIGTAELPDVDATTLTATTLQRLFHVEHVATGTEAQPLNEWRMVHLTDGPDQGLIDRFGRSLNVYLPEFIEIYIRDVCGVELTRI